MKSIGFSLLLLAALAITFSLTTHAQSLTYATLGTFKGTNGDQPQSGSLVEATDGNYYGTTYFGGTYLGGTVFKVTPSGELGDIYSFCAQTNCIDGLEPWSSLVLGSDGNLYGTTYAGGYENSGTIFKMTITGKLVTLYNFCSVGSCADGQYPVGLVRASDGNFYGTTNVGGAHGKGTIFSITPAGKFKTLYSFCSQTNCADGANPSPGLVQASNGILYGTTSLGGDGFGGIGDGTAYQITLAGQFSTLYRFCAQANCADGEFPEAGLTQGADGSFYGTTTDGGANGYGTVFKITTDKQLLTLHSFDLTDGGHPASGLIQANDGNLYGTAHDGGLGLSGGTIYRVTTAGGFRSIHDFCLPWGCTAGYYPANTLMQATNGEFIGTTQSGFGTVYSFSASLNPLVETVPVAGKVGIRVLILGNGLTGTTSVTFNGVAAAFTVGSDTSIRATVPASATTGTVSVTTPSGTLNSNPAFQVLK